MPPIPELFHFVDGRHWYTHLAGEPPFFLPTDDSAWAPASAFSGATTVLVAKVNGTLYGRFESSRMAPILWETRGAPQRGLAMDAHAEESLLASLRRDMRWLRRIGAVGDANTLSIDINRAPCTASTASASRRGRNYGSCFSMLVRWARESGWTLRLQFARPYGKPNLWVSDVKAIPSEQLERLVVKQRANVEKFARIRERRKTRKRTVFLELPPGYDARFAAHPWFLLTRATETKGHVSKGHEVNTHLVSARLLKDSSGYRHYSRVVVDPDGGTEIVENAEVEDTVMKDL